MSVANVGEADDPDAAFEHILSGDVRLFCRTFRGGPGTPLIIMHGANYYDSFDWIDVARKLSQDRMVVAFDQRGFGESDWSASRNYSVDAMIADVRAVISHFDWERADLLGHSASGRLAISFASHHPDLVERLVVVDSAFGKEEGDGKKGAGAGKARIFGSVEEAMAAFAKRTNPPRFAIDEDRAKQAFRVTPEGLMLKRDPHYNNAIPTDGAPVRPVRELDVWRELPGVRCPAMFVRGLRSDRFSDTIMERVRQLQPAFKWADVDARHDIAYEAPQALVDVVRTFICERTPQ